MEKEQFVLPGEKLGVAEEFLPGIGAYEEDGFIFASLVGQSRYDTKSKHVFVIPSMGMPPVPKSGDIVLCEIVDIKEKMAHVEIVAIRGHEGRTIVGSTRARIYITQMAKRYVNRISSEFAINDIVRARVNDVRKDPLELSTADNELGVLFAKCSKCRTPLEINGKSLQCPNCQHIETRKLASDYGSGNI
jgi:exosome complex component CSL4